MKSGTHGAHPRRTAEPAAELPRFSRRDRPSPPRIREVQVVLQAVSPAEWQGRLDTLRQILRQALPPNGAESERDAAHGPVHPSADEPLARSRVAA